MELRAILCGDERDDDAEVILSKLRPLLLADSRSDELLPGLLHPSLLQIDAEGIGHIEI